MTNVCSSSSCMTRPESQREAKFSLGGEIRHMGMLSPPHTSSRTLLSISFQHFNILTKRGGAGAHKGEDEGLPWIKTWVKMLMEVCDPPARYLPPNYHSLCCGAVRAQVQPGRRPAGELDSQASTLYSPVCWGPTGNAGKGPSAIGYNRC